ncbi:MAG: DUF6544 family protein [Acidobacteriota bacterium]
MILFISLGLAAIIAVALFYGARRWQTATDEMHKNLDAARLPIERKTYDANELEGLPASVQRYFRAALKDNQPMISAVSLEQTGTFNLSETGEQWKPFTATQQVITQRPGFDWEARVMMMPGIAVRVHDAYIAGGGILHASLFGLFTMANQRGTPEAAQGELLRFFAEAAWYPTALLPSQGVHWEAVDDTSARATLRDGATTATLQFRFGDDSLIELVRAEARGRTVAGTTIQIPWEGGFGNYELRDGMRIPLTGEVAWMLPEGSKTYFRGRVTKLNYELAQ